MKICPNCQTTNGVDGDAFCYKDGTPLVEMPKCACGRQLSLEHDKYCSQCGAKVEPEKVLPL